MRFTPFAFPTLLAMTLGPRPAWSTSKSMELDIISPVAGGRYRVNPITKIPAVIAVHNKAAGDSHGWLFQWYAHMDDANGAVIASNNAMIGSPGAFSDSFTPITIQDGDPFIAVATADGFGFNTTSGTLPPGEYVFEWDFSVGPWCGPAPDAEQAIIWRNWWTISNGSFHITIDDDVSFPEFDSKSCPSVAGQVSFGATTEYSQTGLLPITTLPCVQMTPVTEKPDPCRATLGVVQAASISSAMSWLGTHTGSNGDGLPTRTGIQAATEQPHSTDAGGAGPGVASTTSLHSTSGGDWPRRLDVAFLLLGTFLVIITITD
ncbi:hypothetical protein QBC34DRAFT_406492 [Podospora aff. communis PSN243]|uniref:DUF7136 domain-containing protein n=1 Tax=Podospora aff. communis PSN243 TaxID=3040156 RepID=A0AAV9GKE1_9PEZI|nr:hypothetical protein QBC34DRAFT_406492 [Podospora aff. communis PSN243]